VYLLQRLILGMSDEGKKKAIQYAAAALAIGLVLSSAWQIALQINHSYAAYGLTLLTIFLTVFTRWHPLYLIVLGAALGIMGLI
jgi:chromate transporter